MRSQVLKLVNECGKEVVLVHLCNIIVSQDPKRDSDLIIVGDDFLFDAQCLY